jgi:hypothetical protein
MMMQPMNAYQQPYNMLPYGGMMNMNMSMNNPMMQPNYYQP